MTPPRHQTSTDRDLEGYAAKKARELAVPHEVIDPVTGVISGPALYEARAKRPTEERIAHLEYKNDLLAGEVAWLRSTIWKILGIAAALISAYIAGQHS